jgi:two-component system chemotaxis response regulator CheY
MAMKILVVDDSSIMRKMVGRALQLTGLPIERIGEANDGFGALDELRAKPYDLVMMDLNMPNLDGVETLRRIRADGALAGKPVVVVSTEGSEPRIASIRELGATFVRKPFTPEAFVDAVIAAIGGAHEHHVRAAMAGDGPDF